jgi:hypothetical protein
LACGFPKINPLIVVQKRKREQKSKDTENRQDTESPFFHLIFKIDHIILKETVKKMPGEH